MRNVLVIGLSKSGTTIIASVIQKSIIDARFFVEPQKVAHLEKLGRFTVPWVVKIIYEHWMDRPFLLDGIVRGETGFSPDRAIAIIRDPRDAVISGLMYRAYKCVLDGGSSQQVNEWLDVMREKEANPERYSLIELNSRFCSAFHVTDTVDAYFEAFVKYTSWINDNRAHVYVLKYEDFVAGRTTDLSANLGIELSDDREVDASLHRVQRTKRSGRWRAIMLPEDVAYLRPRYGAVLAEHGYDGWDLVPDRLNSAEGSDYVVRITREAFLTRAQRSGRQSTPPGFAHSADTR